MMTLPQYSNVSASLVEDASDTKLAPIPWVSVISNALMEVASSLQKEAEQGTSVSMLHGNPLEGGLDKAISHRARASQQTQEGKPKELNQGGFTLLMKDGLL
ncbi:MAG: hypothetical protein ACKO37_01215 [Vampirovibrionales bacterium]